MTGMLFGFPLHRSLWPRDPSDAGACLPSGRPTHAAVRSSPLGRRHRPGSTLLRLRPLSAAAAVTTAALVLTGCGGSDSSNEGGGGGGEQASATENQINPVDRSDLVEGGDLRWAVDELPPNYNYYQFAGTLDDTSDVMQALRPSAFDTEADVAPVVNTDYFDSIELTSENPQVVTYDINPDATWSDGTPITAADLIAQWQATNGTDPAYNISSSNGYDQITSVEA